tara:strand:- start:524 stop:727 length:204 start_codon:yes stop_codon:yes gene_type:complete
MNEIVIQHQYGEEDEIIRYSATIAPRKGETVNIKEKGAAQYAKYLVIEVDHAIYHGSLMVVCSVLPD